MIDSRRAKRAGLALAASVVFAAGCASTPKLYVDRADEAIDCERFGWLQHEGRPASIAEQRLRAEVNRVLVEKGYGVDDPTPDCLVSGVIFTGARPGSPVSVGLGAGRWGGSFGGSVGVSVPVGGASRTVGNLAIDVIDVAQNAEVWRATLEAAFRTPEPGAEEIASAVGKVLAGFPDYVAR